MNNTFTFIGLLLWLPEELRWTAQAVNVADAGSTVAAAEAMGRVSEKFAAVPAESSTVDFSTG